MGQVGAENHEVEITPEMIEAGVSVFRDWEPGVLFYTEGSSAQRCDVEKLVVGILSVREDPERL
jgi:hypothetical protein